LGPLKRLSYDRPVVFAVCLVPLGRLVWRVAANDLGADPVEEIAHQTGRWTLHFLLITLAITPARRFLGWNRLIRYRRTIGLFAFLFASLHLLTFVWLDQWFDWGMILAEVADRLWITIGLGSFLLLVPLAATSTNGMVRRLGGSRWRRLHRLVYVSAAGGILHFWWAVKSDTRVPLVYGSVLVFLLSLRLIPRRRRNVVGSS
jgi:sulfoxide reductase heme-binding subunit YedZ